MNKNIEVNGVTYFVRVEGEGRPILLLHGFTGTGDTWSEFVETYKHTYTFIVPDLLGHGETESPESAERYQMDWAARDLKAILTELNQDAVHVLGYSMGGRLALGFAMRYPDLVTCLVLESSSPGLMTESERLERKEKDAHLAEQIMEDGIESFVKTWTELPLFASQKSLPEHIQEKIQRERLSQNEIGLANSLLGMGTGSQPSWWEELEIFHKPVLLLTGELDEKFVRISKRMAKVLPDCQKVTISGVGHALHVEDCREFGKIVIGFLENN